MLEWAGLLPKKLRRWLELVLPTTSHQMTLDLLCPAVFLWPTCPWTQSRQIWAELNWVIFSTRTPTECYSILSWMACKIRWACFLAVHRSNLDCAVVESLESRREPVLLAFAPSGLSNRRTKHILQHELPNNEGTSQWYCHQHPIFKSQAKI